MATVPFQLLLIVNCFFMTNKFNIQDFSKRMDGAISSLKGEMNKLRTGRANPVMLDGVLVDVYGQQMPVNQLASVSVPEARQLMLQVWDKANVASIEKAIQKSDLGIMPQVSGQIIYLRVPDLTEERRTEFKKIAAKVAESSRVAIRNVRRDGNEHLKKLEKDGEIGKDEAKTLEADIQTLTDKMIDDVNKILSGKEKDIMQI